jgi:hypothetical protein
VERLYVIDHGKVVVQDDLRNLLTLDKELCNVTFEPNGDLPAFVNSLERAWEVC